MSSLGQWRLLRLVSAAERDKLLRRLRPAAAAPAVQQLIQKLEKLLSIKLTQGEKELLDREEGVQKSAPQPAPAPAAARSEPPEKTAPVNSTDTTQLTPGLKVGSEAKEITFDSLMQGFKLKKDLHFGKISQSGWKDNKPIVTKSSIHSRTAYVISALAAGAGADCVLKRTRDYIHHLHQYPEARDLAIKEGAVRVLLRVQERARREQPPHELRDVVHEALALTGYCAPPGGPGPRVLALDGGGIRGLVHLELLRELERLAGRPVTQLFDYIIGVSTGAIIAAVIGSGIGNLETASKMYHTLSKEMFGNTSLIGGTSRLVWSHAYYDTAEWERLLRANLGERALTACGGGGGPLLALVSAAVGARLEPFLFRSYEAGWRRRPARRGTARAALWHAVRASAAAPAYFTEFTLDHVTHQVRSPPAPPARPAESVTQATLQDGGLIVNNPAGVGVAEARLVWGGLAGGTVLSLGTGRPPAPRAPPAPPAATSWRDKFNTILESATDTEGVHLLLNELLERGSYFRLNPPLLHACAMDEIRPKQIQDMLTDTQAYIRRNQHKLEECAKRLTRPRSLPQRAADFARRQALMLGLTDTH